MNMKKKPIILTMLAVTLLLAYGCVSHAAKNAGNYWSGFNSPDGTQADLSSGYVVVDAADARNSNLDGMGPFRSNGPSFSDPDVEMQEEGVSQDEAPGETLPKVETPQSTKWKMVKVAAGDTLSKLSDQHGITIAEIMQANELTNQHKLREGQELYIPTAADCVSDTLAHVKKLKDEALAKRKQAVPLKLTNYDIKNGDTLWNVANAFDLDVNSVFGCNKLNGTEILKVGTTLRIPNQDGILVTVKAGQTLDKLAKEYGIFVEAILSANSMKPGDVLVQGKEIFLPGAKISAFVETSGGKTAVPTAKTTVQRGFGWPVVGKISSPFGWRKDPVRSGRDFHTGLDIRAPRGRPIVASAAGKVVHSGWMGGYGKTIVISHPNGMTTLYAHCSKLLVKSGTNVKRGQRIAQVGSTGRSTGNHVHFEVRQGGRPMNPLKFIR